MKGNFYNTIADDFDRLINKYDTLRRIEVVFDDFLGNENLRGKALLDAGCGSGWFTRKAIERGAIVTSVDIADKLVEITKCKNPAVNAIVASVLNLPFSACSFDYVISSDVIEHTPVPERAVSEMARVLKPGGKLALTCPNLAWKWVVDLATRLKIRPFEGLENFPSFDQLECFVQEAHLCLKRHEGFHPWPFQIPMRGASRWIDRRFGAGGWKRYMINQGIVAVKLESSDA